MLVKYKLLANFREEELVYRKDSRKLHRLIGKKKDGTPSVWMQKDPTSEIMENVNRGVGLELIASAFARIIHSNPDRAYAGVGTQMVTLNKWLPSLEIFYDIRQTLTKEILLAVGFAGAAMGRFLLMDSDFTMNNTGLTQRRLMDSDPLHQAILYQNPMLPVSDKQVVLFDNEWCFSPLVYKYVHPTAVTRAEAPLPIPAHKAITTEDLDLFPMLSSNSLLHNWLRGDHEVLIKLAKELQVDPAFKEQCCFFGIKALVTPPLVWKNSMHLFPIEHFLINEALEIFSERLIALKVALLNWQPFIQYMTTAHSIDGGKRIVEACVAQISHQYSKHYNKDFLFEAISSAYRTIELQALYPAPSKATPHLP